MTEKRIKKMEIDRIESRSEMEDCMKEICMLTIVQDQLSAVLDARLADIRTQYQADLAEVAVNLDVEIERAKDWADNHPEEFAGKKSIVMVHGTVGYRTGMPKLKTIKGWTWDRVLELLQSAYPEYIRRKVETDKEKLIADRVILGDDRLKSMGMVVSQDNPFFVEPNREAAKK